MSIRTSTRVGVVILCAAAAISAQTTRQVPSQYPTIQTAINACVNGDTVLIAPGTYGGTVNFSGKAITVRGSAGAASTIIAGAGVARIVTFSSNEGPNSILDGVTVTGGNGGVLIQNASPTITNCRIVNNVAVAPAPSTASSGGGIRILATAGTVAPTISNCSIDGNTTNTSGGGLDVEVTAPGTGLPVLLNCTLSMNTAAGQGGGAQFLANAQASLSPTLVGCTLSGNWGAYSGGALYLQTCAVVSISGCRIVANHLPAVVLSPYPYVATGSGGGIGGSADQVALVGCTITGNDAAGYGSAIDLSASNVLVRNCTITGNQLNLFSSTAVRLVGTQTNSQLSIVSSIVWGNSSADLGGSPPPTVTYSNIGTGQFAPGVGTISQDPRFADPANGDYHLTVSSPCRNAGSPQSAGLPALDLDGTPRVVGGVVDMGADEFPAIAYPGTNEDVDLLAWVDGAGDPVASTRTALPGSHLKFVMRSAGGTLTGATPIVGGAVYSAGSPPTQVPGYPSIWLMGSAFVLYGNLTAPPFTIPGLPTAGLTFEFLTPPGLAGLGLRLQGLVTTPLAANSAYAATGALDVTF